MKITVDLVRVSQDWDPDTNRHTNFVVFSFGGVEARVPATEEQVRQIIIASQEQRANLVTTRRESLTYGDTTEYEEIDENAGGDELDRALEAELVNDEETVDQVVFGGDYDEEDKPLPAAPSLFQEDVFPPEASDQDGLQDDPVPDEEEAPKPMLTPTQQRKATIAARRGVDPAVVRKNAMRERAANAPQSRPRKNMVTQDEMGNPVPYVDRSTPIVGPVGRPEVILKQPSGPSVAGEDDGFAQG